MCEFLEGRDGTQPNRPGTDPAVNRLNPVTDLPQTPTVVFEYSGIMSQAGLDSLVKDHHLESLHYYEDHWVR
eukprot:COSAG02_NODE_18433_length_939_cov_0.832143_1_plen_72_part_00